VLGDVLAADLEVRSEAFEWEARAALTFYPEMTQSNSKQLTLGFGIFGYVTGPEVLKVVRLADDLGVSNAWLGDSQNIWRETYTLLGASSVLTRNIILGPGVTNVTTRHVSVIASAMLTLSELSDGRIALGVGRGDSAVRTLGGDRASHRVFSEKLKALQALLAGNHVHETQSVEADRPYRITYARDEREGVRRVPLYLAASGPRSLELAGKIADGVILLVGSTPDAIEAAINYVEAGAGATGRSLDDVHTVLWTPVSIADNTQQALDAVRPHVAGNVNVRAPWTDTLTHHEREAIENVRTQYDYWSHVTLAAHHAAAVPNSLVEKVALAGTVEECRDRLKEIATTRVQQIAAVPAGNTDAERPWIMEEFTRNVFDMVNRELRAAASNTARA
jgi:5,10-methylenetetrahydromethanopterin reductase